MRLILRHMKRLKLGLIELSLPSVYLTASLLLSGCAGLKPFPEQTLYEFDPKTPPVCAEYKIVDEENLKYEWVKDIPFKDCPAIFGFTDKQIPNILNWGRDAKKFAREHCR